MKHKSHKISVLSIKGIIILYYTNFLYKLLLKQNSLLYLSYTNNSDLGLYLLSSI